jgi:hypothetical protein
MLYSFLKHKSLNYIDYVSLQFLHSVNIGGEHKAHVMQVNSKITI